MYAKRGNRVISNYDFIIDGMQWSFSRVNSFGNCKYGWYLNYVECVDKIDNFFAEYGILYHEILEKFFSGELEIFQLLKFYEEHYNEYVKSSPPPYPEGMAEKYYNAGIDFFENFDFDLSLYDVVFIEAEIDVILGKYNVIVKPDLVLREKKTGRHILYDYKTADPFGKRATPNKEKIEEYMKQMHLYCWGIEQKYGFCIDEIILWFVRAGKEYSIKFNQEECQKTLRWFKNEIHKIEQEEEFKATPSKYFCENICGVRLICPYKNGE
jgi:hypothetical protein